MMYKDFYQPQNYVNRELSWIDFNGRVLEEALAPENPLLERANFLGDYAKQRGRVLYGTSCLAA